VSTTHLIGLFFIGGGGRGDGRGEDWLGFIFLPLNCDEAFVFINFFFFKTPYLKVTAHSNYSP
jgi:hypothetical protein